MIQEEIRYRADGLDMVGQFFAPSDSIGPVPGVLVFPEAFGLGSHAVSRAKRLASMGYAALACDLHGGGRRHMDINTVLDLILPIRAAPERLHDRANVPLELLRERPDVDGSRVAAIGYCIGGTMVLELLRNGATLSAAVGFHGGLSPVSAGRISDRNCRILMCVGSEDPLIPQAERVAFEKEMQTAATDWQLNIYGGVVHSFTDAEADQRGEPDQYRYSPHADADSWRAMQVLLAETFVSG